MAHDCKLAGVLSHVLLKGTDILNEIANPQGRSEQQSIDLQEREKTVNVQQRPLEKEEAETEAVRQRSK